MVCNGMSWYVIACHGMWWYGMGRNGMYIVADLHLEPILEKY